jgi:hypothetical protein
MVFGAGQRLLNPVRRMRPSERNRGGQGAAPHDAQFAVGEDRRPAAQIPVGSRKPDDPEKRKCQVDVGFADAVCYPRPLDAREGQSDRPALVASPCVVAFMGFGADPSDDRTPGMIPRRMTPFPAVMAAAIKEFMRVSFP